MINLQLLRLLLFRGRVEKYETFLICWQEVLLKLRNTELLYILLMKLAGRYLHTDSQKRVTYHYGFLNSFLYDSDFQQSLHHHRGLVHHEE